MRSRRTARLDGDPKPASPASAIAIPRARRPRLGGRLNPARPAADEYLWQFAS